MEKNNIAIQFHRLQGEKFSKNFIFSFNLLLYIHININMETTDSRAVPRKISSFEER